MDSILLTTADVPLLEQFGADSVDEFERNVEWTGSRYFYSGFNTFWKISSFASGLPAQDPVQFSFDQWQRHWGEGSQNQESWSRVVWKQLPDSTPFHAHTPADYALDETSAENDAHLGAVDKTDAGFHAQDLPPLPSVSIEASPAVSPPVAPPEEEQ
jgi:hypothetical protein